MKIQTIKELRTDENNQNDEKYTIILLKD